MQPVGPAVPFYETVLAWIFRTLILTLICTFLAWLGIRVLDALTPKIHEREMIGKNPIAVGLFIGGFLIFIGLVIHGALATRFLTDVPFLENLVTLRELGLIAISFFISLVIGIAIFHIADRLTPKIPFHNIKRSPIAVGIYIFGYLVFFGLILHAALTMQLL
jgi:uncharacterized membrane protein YjfL (UPF0719 family)